MWKTSLISDLTPPCLERSWQSTPHPSLPLVATSSADKTVRIYSLVNYKLISVVSGGHKRSIRSSAWKPTASAGVTKGESVLATGSFDATVGIWRRWDDYNNNEEHEHDHVHDHDHDHDHDEREEDEEEWRFAVLLDGHDSEVKSLSWSASGSLLATCSRDKSIWIWEDLDDGDNNFETVAVLQEHSADVKCVAWHPTEECLASGSYDDTVRVWREDIDDWGQVACLKGHRGTVWYVDWEGVDYVPFFASAASVPADEQTKIKEAYREHFALSGPRIASCSADKTIRIWRREAKPQTERSAFSASNTGIPSIIRPTGLDETWHEDAILPAAHDLAVYAVAWSKRSGLVASTGADGRIVVYAEFFALSSSDDEPKEGDEMDTSEDAKFKTEWKIVATIEAAHGIYEVNHIAWAKRSDRRGSQTDEEILISTGDDGSVKVWSIERE